MIPPSLVSAIRSAPWFQEAWAPYVLLDEDLRIRASNRAFSRVTGFPAERLLDQVSTEVFAAPDEGVDGTATFLRSTEHVLSTGRTSWLGLQRHDLPHPHDRGVPVPKVWLPVQQPVLEHGRVVGVLHHVQDATPAAGLPASVPRTPRAYATEMARQLDLLQRQFPWLLPETVLGVLTDSHRIVLDVVRAADPAKAAELARLRLEVLGRGPARSA